MVTIAYSFIDDNVCQFLFTIIDLEHLSIVYKTKYTGDIQTYVNF